VTSRALDAADGSRDNGRAMTAPLRSDARWRRERAAACCAFVSVFAACVSAPRDEPPVDPVVFESRTGVPLLMDLPLIGWMFQRRTTVR